MICPHCNADNVQGARFCNQCGRSLAPGRQRPDLAIDAMIADYLRAVEKNPSDAMSRYNLGLAYRLKGLNSLAEAEWKRVRELSPDFADLEFQLALLYRERGDTEEARAAAAKALDIDPTHERARRLLDHLLKK